MFQPAPTSRTYINYSSNLTVFFKFCNERALEPLEATPVDIAHYIAWLGLRGIVSATTLTPHLSAINRFLQDHALPPAALGPLVARVRKGLMNCQADTAPLPERMSLPAPVALAILELDESLFVRTA